MILALFYLQVTLMLPTKFGVNCLWVQENKRKIDSQDGSYGSNLGFPIWMILAILIYYSYHNAPIKFQDNQPFVSEVKNRFSRRRPWGPSWILHWNNFSYFFLIQVTQMFPIKFHFNWPFVSGEEGKNRFSRWWPWWPSWNSDRNDFSNFCSIRHPNISYQVSTGL